MEYEMSERHACRLMGLGRSTHRYRARQDGDARLRVRLKELAAQRMRLGYRRLTAMLEREGMQANHKRAYTDCIARKGWRCGFGNDGGSAGVVRWLGLRRIGQANAGRWIW